MVKSRDLHVYVSGNLHSVSSISHLRGIKFPCHGARFLQYSSCTTQEMAAIGEAVLVFILIIRQGFMGPIGPTCEIP